jgi:hypothetical protein
MSTLTKREQFAVMAMQGHCANADLTDTPGEVIAKWSVEQADALIAELGKPEAEAEPTEPTEPTEPAKRILVSAPAIDRAIEALPCSFVWSQTPQGRDYWSQVEKNLRAIREAA